MVPVEVDMSVLKQPRRYTIMLDIALVIVTLILGSFGLTGYLTYGACTQQTITLNFPVDEVRGQVLIWGLILAIMLTYPMMLYPVSEILEQIIYIHIKKEKRVPDLAWYSWQSITVRLVMLIFSGTKCQVNNDRFPLTSLLN